MSNTQDSIYFTSPDSSLITEMNYQNALQGQSLIISNNKQYWTTTPTPGRYNLVTIDRLHQQKELSPKNILTMKEEEFAKTTAVVTSPPGSIFPRYGFLEGGLPFRILGNEIPDIESGQMITLDGQVEELDQFVRLKVKKENLKKHNTKAEISAVDLTKDNYSSRDLASTFAFQFVEIEGEVTALKHASFDISGISVSIPNALEEYPLIANNDIFKIKGIIYPTTQGDAVLYPFQKNHFTLIKASSEKDESEPIDIDSGTPTNSKNTTYDLTPTKEQLKNAPLSMFLLSALIPSVLYATYHFTNKINPIA
jgi:hypothetical protein